MDCCSICLEQVDSSSSLRTDCGHPFHPKCIFTCVSKGGHACPVCREPLYEKEEEAENLIAVFDITFSEEAEEEREEERRRRRRYAERRRRVERRDDAFRAKATECRERIRQSERSVLSLEDEMDALYANALREFKGSHPHVSLSRRIRNERQRLSYLKRRYRLLLEKTLGAEQEEG